MVTGEKSIEYRKPTNWLLSRMYAANRERKLYTHVKCVNGYGNDKPYFIAELKMTEINIYPHVSKFSNGLIVNVDTNDWLFHLGSIIETGNLYCS